MIRANAVLPIQSQATYSRLRLAVFLVVPAKAQFVANWFDRVSQTQRQQPQWMTPVATTTPRLDQEIHFDTDILRQSNGFTTDNYGGSKGFELIPAEHLQVNTSRASCGLKSN
jgi:hypothetical protein